MKVLAFIALVLAIFGTLDAQPQSALVPAIYQRANTDIAEEIKQVIDKIWAYLPAEIGIKDWEFSLPSNFFFGGKIRIGDLSISGFKALDMKILKYDPATSRLDYEFNFGDIIGAIDYSFSVTGLFNIDHHFTFHIDLKDLNTQGFATMETVDGYPKKITDFKVLVTLGDSQFDIKGFLNNEKLSQEFTEFLNKNVAPIFDKVTPMLSPFFSELIKTTINIALSILG